MDDLSINFADQNTMALDELAKKFPYHNIESPTEEDYHFVDGSSTGSEHERVTHAHSATATSAKNDDPYFSIEEEPHLSTTDKNTYGVAAVHIIKSRK